MSDLLINVLQYTSVYCSTV